MDMDARKKRVKEYNDIMEKLIVKYQNVLGPQECVVHGDDVNDCDEHCDIRPVGSLMRTWILVTGWEITDDERDDVGFSLPDYFTPEGSMSWEQIGLLTHALDDIRGVA